MQCNLYHVIWNCFKNLKQHEKIAGAGPHGPRLWELQKPDNMEAGCFWNLKPASSWSHHSLSSFIHHICWNVKGMSTTSCQFSVYRKTRKKFFLIYQIWSLHLFDSLWKLVCEHFGWKHYSIIITHDIILFCGKRKCMLSGNRRRVILNHKGFEHHGKPWPARAQLAAPFAVITHCKNHQLICQLDWQKKKERTQF